jgi:hypothetical protein
VLAGGENIHCNYVSSTLPAPDGNKYYAQLVTSYNDGIYYVNIILRDVRDFEDSSKWLRYDFQLKSIDEFYELCESFLTSCEKLNIITTKQKYPLEAN